MKVSDWMRPLEQHFAETGGNRVEDLINGHTSVGVNAPLAILECCAFAQYVLLLRLQAAGLLKEP